MSERMCRVCSAECHSRTLGFEHVAQLQRPLAEAASTATRSSVRAGRDRAPHAHRSAIAGARTPASPLGTAPRVPTMNNRGRDCGSHRTASSTTGPKRYPAVAMRPRIVAKSRPPWDVIAPTTFSSTTTTRPQLLHQVPERVEGPAARAAQSRAGAREREVLARERRPREVRAGRQIRGLQRRDVADAQFALAESPPRTPPPSSPTTRWRTRHSHPSPRPRRAIPPPAKNSYQVTNSPQHLRRIGFQRVLPDAHAPSTRRSAARARCAGPAPHCARPSASNTPGSSSADDGTTGSRARNSRRRTPPPAPHRRRSRDNPRRPARACRHPRTPDRTSRARSTRSVERFPVDFTAAMVRERTSRETLSMSRL